MDEVKTTLTKGKACGEVELSPKYLSIANLKT